MLTGTQGRGALLSFSVATVLDVSECTDATAPTAITVWAAVPDKLCEVSPHQRLLVATHVVFVEPRSYPLAHAACMYLTRASGGLKMMN